MKMKDKAKRLFKRAGKALWLSDRLTMLMASVLVAVVLTGVVAGASPGSGSTATHTNVGGTDVTISRFSEIVSAAFATNISESYTQSGALSLFMENVDKSPAGFAGSSANMLLLGKVGNVLGYIGQQEGASNTSNFWTDGSDASSKMITLDTIWELHDNDEAQMGVSAIAQYVIWGSALNYMGVDEFRDATGNTDGIRMMTGYAAYVFFVLAYTASEIMTQVLKMMQDLNVFRWVWEGLKGGIHAMITSLLGVSSYDEVPLLKELMAAFDQLLALRWVILGVLVLLFVASITVWKTQGYNRAAAVQQKGRKLLYRLIIMCIGIPLCGMFYTECLDFMLKHEGSPLTVDNTKSVVTSYIFQEFMDFEGWTVGLTDANGALRSFQTGSASGASGSSNPYGKMKIKYETKGDRFTIAASTYGGIGATMNSVDISRFVYSVNETVYGKDVTGDSTSAKYLNSLYGKPEGTTTNSNYADIVNDAAAGFAGMSDANKKEAYNNCRDLLLRYARSSTVKPDVLNRYYSADMKRLADALPSASASAGGGAGGGGGSSDNATNESAAMNSQVIEQLFGANASEQRVWSFVQLDSPWIYPNAAVKTITMMDSTMSDGTAAKVEISLEGLAAASASAANLVTVKSDSGTAQLMAGTLGNAYVRGNGSYAATRNICLDGTPVVKVDDAGAGSQGSVSNYQYEYTYRLDEGGISPLAMYNFLHSKFEGSTLTVYSPKLTTNAGVGTMHYAVTTPYSGIPEIVQLLFTLSVLFSLGIIGWVFGVSLLVNTIVQMMKAFPVMFKMLMGSVQGFVEGLLLVFSCMAEMLVTIALYMLSVDIIDFLIRLIRGLAAVILNAFNIGGNQIDPESYAIVAGLLSTAVILWGTFNLLKWRVAITLSIKSMITHVLNQIFGTSAAMPTGASSNMMKAAAGLAAGGMIAGSLAESGQLDDVVNDLTQSDLGSSVHDKISEGDWEGAMQDIQDYANGEYVSEDAAGDINRGENADDWAQQKLGDGADSLDGTFGMQSLTDAQQQELDDKYKDDALAAASKLDEARKSGDPDKIKEAQDEFDDIMQARAEDAAAMRAENGRKARELGVADYGDYLRAQGEEAEGMGMAPVEGADIPEDPGKELTADGQAAYDAARDGDAETLRSMAGVYDANGLTEEQQEAVNEAVKNGASEAEVAEMVEGFAEENFGENHAAVVDKMNEASGRASGALYGSSDNSDGNARTMAVASGHGEDGARTYGVKDNSSDEGAKTFTTKSDGSLQQEFSSELPEDPGQSLSGENQEVYDAAVNGDQQALAEAADRLDENGLTADQAAEIDQMVADGASSEEIASKMDEFATQNLGENHKAVMERVNSAAGRGNSAEYGDQMGGRTVAVRAKNGSLEGNGTDWGVKDSEAPGKGESTVQMDGDGNAHELPSAISSAPSKALTAENQAIFEAARDGDTAMLQQMAGHVNSQGIDHAQEQVVRDMIAAGASETEVAAAIDNFAQDNFGDDYRQVIDKMNEAAGRDGTVTYSTPTGGGEDGTQPRSMEVTSGYANGGTAYAINDSDSPNADGLPTMVQATDAEGQSVYTSTNGASAGEQIVTSDFGSRAGQTYGSIRSEVGAVANASGGLIQRGSGSGDFGKTTVSEAASEIAARNSRDGATGKAKAKVGDQTSYIFGSSENTDMNNYNKAVSKALENSGLEKGQVAGIAGGVDKKTGAAVTEIPSAPLPTAEQPQGLNLTGQMPAGSEIPVNADNGNGGATLIASSPVDSYGRSQELNLQSVGIPTTEAGPVAYTDPVTGQVTYSQPAGGPVAYGQPSGPVAVDPNAVPGSPDMATVLSSGSQGVVTSVQPDGGGVSYGKGQNPMAITPTSNGSVSAADIPFADAPMQAAASEGAAGVAEVIANNGNVNADIPMSGQGTLEIQPQAQQAPAASVTETVDQAVETAKSKIDLPTGLGMAAAAMTFVKTGSLSGAVSSYVGTERMVSNLTGQTEEQPQQQVVEGQPQQVQYQQSGQPAAPSQGNVQYQQPAGQAAAPSQGNVQYQQPSAPMTVEVKGGGSMQAIRGDDGAFYAVSPGGGASTQKLAMTGSGTYTPVTTTPEGKTVGAGGQPAVQLTDGSYVTVTRNDKGQTVMANDDGQSSGTILTQTAQGWQPAVTASNGVTYSVDHTGQPTGAVTVTAKDGGTVSVVKAGDGSLRMANADGSASSVKMVEFAGGSYGTVDAAGYTTTSGSSPQKIQVSRMDTGSQAVIVESPSGGYRIANADGSPSMEVVRQNPNGTWTKIDRTEENVTNVNTTTTTTSRSTSTEQPTPNPTPFQPFSYAYGMQPQVPLNLEGTPFSEEYKLQLIQGRSGMPNMTGIPQVGTPEFDTYLRSLGLDPDQFTVGGDGDDGSGWNPTGSYTGGENR